MDPLTHKTTLQNHAVTWCFSRSNSNGKEKDYESGFHYYGARYYWCELLTGWLSVDPMADKYPSMSPYNYCAWNPVKLLDPDGRDFDPTMEKCASQVERYCDIQIKNLSEKESLTDEQKSRLSELQSAKDEILKMRDDNSAYYCLQSGSFGEKERKTKGVTHYYGCGEFTRKGEQQHEIMVSLNVDCGLFTEKGVLNMKGLQVLGHELKHCYQFYNKELLYIQSADGGRPKAYNTKTLEEAAFKRGDAFGSPDRFDAANYPDLVIGTIDDFIQKNPECTVIKHK